MHKISVFRAVLIALLLLLGVIGVVSAQEPSGEVGAQVAVSTAFTFQGNLDDGGPANDAYDFEFELHSVPSGGSALGIVLKPNQTVTEGLFSVELDFGNKFDGNARWLQVNVRKTSVGGSYTALTPRQPLTAAPYALFSVAPWVTSGSNLSYNAGNVGIGTTTPARKLTVLTDPEDYGIEHTDGTVRMSTFIGKTPLVTGINGGWLGTVTNHPLYFFTNDQDTSMTIAANGDVGIGSRIPLTRLHVEANVPKTTVATTRAFAVSTNDASNPFALDVRLVGAAALADRGVYLQTTDWNLAGGGNLLLQPEGGRVGIGTTTPDYNLTVLSPPDTWGFATTDGTINTAIGSVSGGAILGTTSNHPLSLRTNNTTRMTIAETGNVGIGDSTPTEGRLVVGTGTGSATLNGYGYLIDDPTSAGHNAATVIRPYSIFANGDIAAREIDAWGVFVASDARIKNIQRRSDGVADLATLSQIEITDYTFKDVIDKGSDPLKKVIGQQVEAVYPQAVNHITGVVPDIYQKAPIKDGWVELVTDLQPGERVRLIGENKQDIHEVLEVAQDGFRTDFVADGDEVFVYGREVKDFRNVDYDAIAMLNVSATQELNRLVEQQAAEIEALNSENEALNTRLTALEQAVSSVDAASYAESNSPLTPWLVGGLGLVGLAVVAQRRSGGKR